MTGRKLWCSHCGCQSTVPNRAAASGSHPEDWQAEMKGEVFDLVQCAQRIYTGAAASTSQVLIDRPQEWAQWIFSVGNVWQEDSPMPDRPLTVHCSGLGGGLLSPEHEYDIFFQNHAQMKVYGPSLAMTDDWEQRITQLGLTKTTHEYAILGRPLFARLLFLTL